jgi:hypothetical protein
MLFLISKPFQSLAIIKKKNFKSEINSFCIWTYDIVQVRLYIDQKRPYSEQGRNAMEQKRLREGQRRLYRGQKRLDYEQERPCKE